MTPPTTTPQPDPHPRDTAIEAATRELIEWVKIWVVAHDLTYLEMWFILTGMLGRQVQTYVLREREFTDTNYPAPGG